MGSSPLRRPAPDSAAPATAASPPFVRHPYFAPRFLPAVPSASSIPLANGRDGHSLTTVAPSLANEIVGGGSISFPTTARGSSSFSLTNELSTAFLPHRVLIAPSHKTQALLPHNMVMNPYCPGVQQPSNPPLRVLFEEMETDACGGPRYEQTSTTCAALSYPTTPLLALLTITMGGLIPPMYSGRRVYGRRMSAHGWGTGGLGYAV
ncbi:hypothetical protein BD779DRAFT_1473557 [Infundibulicybe gibba]|nr:hypothetical protein BD779DRAFT_1473557 [Infundibulicybe gibba]